MVDKINLSVDADSLARFCQKLIKRSRDISITHDALVTLESFIVLFGKSLQGTKEYAAIEGLIKSYTDQTREQLLQLRAKELLLALKSCDVAAVTAVHVPLSRDGFHTILQQVVGQFSAVERDEIAQWAIQWSDEAKQKAEAASAYPDAMDFQKAGIRLEQYQAMLDVSRNFAQNL